MLRVLFYVALIFLVAAGFAWLADRPGAIVLTWQHTEVRTSLMVVAIALLIFIAVLAFLAAFVRAIIQAPRMIDAFFINRRRDRGYRSLSSGLIAVGAGNTRDARRAASEASALLSGEPLTLLLTAQAAQLAGDADGARNAFDALAENNETRLVGLHGLFVEARRQGDHEAARRYAEEAVRLDGRIAWAGLALFDYQCRSGDWQGALRTLAANTDAGLTDKETAKRLRAVLLTARAQEMEAGDPLEAGRLAVEANRLAPDLVPASVTAARLFSRAGEVRRASRLLEAAWRTAPHPEIADAYAIARPGDSAVERLKRMRKLASLTEGGEEGTVAVARAAIDAHEWDAAREALAAIVASGQPSERTCLLMAEIEDRESGDQGRVRGWLSRALTARRDPAWVADGQVFEHWAPLTPVSRRLDGFEWKVVAAPPTPTILSLPPAMPTLPASVETAEPASEAEEPVDLSPVEPEPEPPAPPIPAPAPVVTLLPEPAPPPREEPAPILPVATPLAMTVPTEASVPAARAVSEPPPTPPEVRAPDDPGPIERPPEPAGGARRGFWPFSG